MPRQTESIPEEDEATEVCWGGPGAGPAGNGGAAGTGKGTLGPAAGSVLYRWGLPGGGTPLGFRVGW